MSYHSDETQWSFKNITRQSWWNKNTFKQGLWLLFISPFIFLLEMALYQKAREAVLNPSHDTRLKTVSYELLKTPSIRIIKINCPEKVLQFSRGLATSMSLTGSIQRNGDQVKMWAVSRNAKNLLVYRDIRYIDPVALPTELKASLQLPFDSGLLTNFLLIPQVIN